ncbi:MAG: acyltransferase [Bacteroidetes bacterium]|nr:MAG: acyltransferase [Bacteroidota bacterium]
MLKQNDYFPHVNLLRGIAALMVCVYHFSHFQCFDGSLFSKEDWIYRIGEYGSQGVTAFFVISGFVIPFSMHKGQYVYRAFGRFLVKRSIRIEPPYIATIIVILLIGYYLSRRWGNPFEFHPEQFALHIGYLIPFSEYEWYNPVFWTLAIEFQYYILMALIFPLITGNNRIMRHLVLAVFLAGHFLPQYKSTLPEHAGIFIPGIVLFLYRAGYFKPAEMLGWFFASLCLLFYDQSLVICVITMLTFFAIWLLRSDTKAGNWLGNISYSLYLLHGSTGMMFLLFRSSSTFSTLDKYGAFLLAVLISLIAAYVFWFFVEQPSKIMSQNFKLHKPK